MKKKNFIYFIISSLVIFIIIYGGFFYNIYIHPSEIINSSGQSEIHLFGDFTYLFKIINCYNDGFNVYAANNCYEDKYGSFLYGPTILIFPKISQEIAFYLIHIISTIFILSFVYLTIKIIKPNSYFEYFLVTLILFNPTTLFLYEKLNIDILIYIFLILLVYYFKNNLIKFFVIFILTLTKFYPVIISIIFLVQKKIEIKNILYFLSSMIALIIFIYLFWDNLISVVGTLEYVSQSFRYAFSLDSLNRILIHLINYENKRISQLFLIIFALIFSYMIYYFLLRSSVSLTKDKFNNDCIMFILSLSLSIPLYLIFGNNFYREIYLIGIVPFLLKNLDLKISRLILTLFISKYLFLMVFFPYYYNADLNINKIAQFLVVLKSSLDYAFICILISVLFLFIKSYLNEFLIYLKKN